MPIKRYALVRGLFGSGGTPSEKVAAYLPANYKVIWEGLFPAYTGQTIPDIAVVIAGRDDHGFDLTRYVLPRLGSGMMAAEEIDLSHPVMKLIPA